MQELHSDDSEELFIASVDEGMLSEDYDLVGIQDSGPGEDSGTGFRGAFAEKFSFRFSSERSPR